MKTTLSALIIGILAFTLTGSGYGQCFKDLPMEEVSESEISSLQWMREEEMLAHDVYDALAGEVDNQDIKFVYNNLLKGSKHHLKAFWFHASSNSITYEPEHISQEQFDGIVGTEKPSSDKTGRPCAVSTEKP